MHADIPKIYDPKQVETKWSQYWNEQAFFTPSKEAKGEPFTIVIPPPNVTDRLHIGHALNNTLQDVIIRMKRMQGFDALWLPGTDHAGIATQNVVERRLMREGKSRHDLGREAFVTEVWKWKEQYGKEITDQLKTLGASCDWTRERFTMDEGCSRAVRETFVKLYQRGLIYRGSYIVNWCPHCRTAISDDEVEHAERQGKLYLVRYPLVNGGHITVATTRPETILGDTAIAVNPSDARYQDLIGQEAILPVLGRRIPIIADDYVDAEFGTGVVKVTPSHDPNDFEIAERHALPHVKVLNLDGTMNAEAGPYAGLDRYECRKQLLQELAAGGLLVETREHQMQVGECYRCDTTIEPMVSRQWFVRMKPLAEPALAAVREGTVQFVPERFAKVYLHWVENVKDWCISRQIWWGHTLPVWYCDCGETIVATDTPAACPNCHGRTLTPETDVLDTWFSSALWPFATLGWPNEQATDLQRFFPTQVLVTGYDIIFFWVARMVFMSYELTGNPPFSHVLINGLVRDAEGRKMSKSLGNGIDPMAVVESFGADTLRFTLLSGNTPGNDMRFYQEKLEANRAFCNKIWNAARFVLLNLGESDLAANELPDDGLLTLADKYILAQLNATTENVTRLMEQFEFGEAARHLYDFLWSEYCDWYIEMAKPNLQAGGERKQATLSVLCYTLSRTLEMLHPFMPFITEEIWQALPHRGTSITVAAWPKHAGRADDGAQKQMAALMEAIRAIRNLRAEMGVPPSRRLDVTVVPTTTEWDSVYRAGTPYILALAGGKEASFAETNPFAKGEAVSLVVTGAQIHLALAQLVDVQAEIKRLQTEQSAVLAEIDRARGKLQNEGFRAKAPAALIATEEAKLLAHETKLAQLEKRLAELQ